MMIIDSQVHPYPPNTPERPWHNPKPKFLPHVTGEEMVAAMDSVGVDGAVIVNPGSVSPYDGSYNSQVYRDHPGRFCVVRPVDPRNPAAGEVVAEWKRAPGTVGIRCHWLDTHRGGGAPDDPKLDHVLSAAAREGLLVNLHCYGNLVNATALIDRHAGTRFVIDHLGIVQPRSAPAAADAWDDLPRVLELARRANVAAIKVSGACTLSRQGYPYDDIWDPLWRIFDAWGLERCLWGSDWTRTYNILTYAQSVDAFRLSKRLSDSERAMLMGGACAKTYGWSPQR